MISKNTCRNSTIVFAFAISFVMHCNHFCGREEAVVNWTSSELTERVKFEFSLPSDKVLKFSRSFQGIERILFRKTEGENAGVVVEVSEKLALDEFGELPKSLLKDGKPTLILTRKGHNSWKLDLLSQEGTASVTWKVSVEPLQGVEGQFPQIAELKAADSFDFKTSLPAAMKNETEEE